jgi:ABC-type multidrug transport system fused ATPase/permease subunit
LRRICRRRCSGIRQVKGAGAEKFEKKRFQDLTWGYFKAVVRTERIRSLASPLTEMIGALGTVILLWYGSNLVLVDHQVRRRHVHRLPRLEPQAVCAR